MGIVYVLICLLITWPHMTKGWLLTVAALMWRAGQMGSRFITIECDSTDFELRVYINNCIDPKLLGVITDLIQLRSAK